MGFLIQKFAPTYGISKPTITLVAFTENISEYTLDEAPVDEVTKHVHQNVPHTKACFFSDAAFPQVVDMNMLKQWVRWWCYHEMIDLATRSVFRLSAHAVSKRKDRKRGEWKNSRDITEKHFQ
ncbi:hypothetical protein, unlikely [Trypanosoma congolense IL3000]|uniref:Uncharacterized protein n=1 Tax=Trypanosoma congolense (strain IL3000) TaxID=1068625 RepID=F9WJY7_TRYCI|nr:hypothetical protein, unlikely [Trypanosoma congolense IL3000]